MASPLHVDKENLSALVGHPFHRILRIGWRISALSPPVAGQERVPHQRVPKILTTIISYTIKENYLLEISTSEDGAGSIIW